MDTRILQGFIETPTMSGITQLVNIAYIVNVQPTRDGSKSVIYMIPGVDSINTTLTYSQVIERIKGAQ